MATNFERLTNEGIIREPEKFPPQDKATIEKLTEPEVDAIISANTKLGNDFLTRNLNPHGLFF